MLAFIHPCGRTLSERRVIPALLNGAAFGTALTALPIVLLAGLGGVGFTLLILSIAFFSWLAGIVFLGAPAWYLAHRLRLRCWSAAMGIGALALAIPSLLTNRDPTLAAFAAVLGSLVGLVVWLTAYRKTPQ